MEIAAIPAKQTLANWPKLALAWLESGLSASSQGFESPILRCNCRKNRASYLLGAGPDFAFGLSFGLSWSRLGGFEASVNATGGVKNSVGASAGGLDATDECRPWSQATSPR